MEVQDKVTLQQIYFLFIIDQIISTKNEKFCCYYVLYLYYFMPYPKMQQDKQELVGIRQTRLHRFLYWTTENM